MDSHFLQKKSVLSSLTLARPKKATLYIYKCSSSNATSEALKYLLNFKEDIYETPDSDSELGLPRQLDVPLHWPECGAISFQGVSLQYTYDGPFVLKDIHLDIQYGQKVGVVGRTGGSVAWGFDFRPKSTSWSWCYMRNKHIQIVVANSRCIDRLLSGAVSTLSKSFW